MDRCDGKTVCSTCPMSNTCSDEDKLKRQNELLNSRLSRIKYKIMVMSGKGGVGKTTVSVNLALALADMGYRIGLLDADFHGPNVAMMFGLEGKHLFVSDQGIEPYRVNGVSIVAMSFLLAAPDTPVIWRGPLKSAAIRQFLSEVNWGDLDFLIVDLPPGTGDEALSMVQIIRSLDGVIIVTTPQEVALLDATKSINFAKKLGIRILGVVENMSGFICPHCGNQIDIFKKGGGEAVAAKYSVPFLGRVPLDPKIVEVEDMGLSIYQVAAESPASESFRNIANMIIKELEQGG